MNQGGVTMAHVNIQKPLETGISKGMNKRRRKMVVESSENNSEEEETALKGVSGGPGGDSVERRKSARQKQQVLYQEGGSDDLILQNRSRLRIMEEVPACDDKSCDPANVDKEVNKQKACEHAKNMEKHIMKGAEPVPLDHSGNLSPEIVDCPDSEFSNFDKDKEAHCFAVDQIWACYDSLDSLPRFYALVRRIYKSEFRLRLTWLEPELESNAEIKWAEEGLPVACGKFVKGKTEEMIYEKGSCRFSYVIYPRAGEIWALFKDWNIEWSLDPEHHKRYKFVIVEILSVQDDGISVAFLLKVKGFVSVFQRTIPAELAKLTIPFNERLRFSHRIKSVKLNGTEREGVPSGSFELDMASLPLEDYSYSNKVSINPNNAMGQTSQSHVEKVKPATHLSNTRKKYMNGLDSQMLNLRRSPRGLKGGDQPNGVKDRVTNGQSSQSPEETVKPTPCLSYTPSKRLNGFHNEMVSLRRSPRGLTGYQSNGDIDTISERFMKSPWISSLSPACGY
uniref:uncharacterized protein LOC122587859 n=1 Tax=Erigeron canadensis TaxID=72917 RepID=UPI001CB934E1|nr:uncharacterized protein LOC122587859 [Erigeron canadensis]